MHFVFTYKHTHTHTDAYHLLRNSPTKSILSTSQHSTPQRAATLSHPLNQQPSSNNACTPIHTNNRHSTAAMPPPPPPMPSNHQFIQIRPTNIDNVALNVQANNSHCPVNNSVTYDFQATIPMPTHPIYVQQQEANGRFCLVPATSLSLAMPPPPPMPPVAVAAAIQPLPPPNPINKNTPSPHSYQFIAMPSTQAILLDKSQRNSHPAMLNNQQLHTATVHGKWRFAELYPLASIDLSIRTPTLSKDLYNYLLCDECAM